VRYDPAWIKTLTVFIAMRYWHPLTEETVRLYNPGHYEQILSFPSTSIFARTTLSSLHEWNRRQKLAVSISDKIYLLLSESSDVVEALTDNVTSALQKFSALQRKISTSFLALTEYRESYIKKGDPYQIHVEETVRAILKLGIGIFVSTLCYQSNVGPMHLR